MSTPVATEFRVNTTTTGNQEQPAVKGLSDGGFLVVWASPDGSGRGIYAQRYDSTGTPVGSETRINTTTGGEQYDPMITPLSGGGYVVTWHGASSTGGADDDIYSQIYNSAGVKVGVETRVNTYTHLYQYQPTITTVSNGDYVVAWISYLQDGSEYGIYAQRYDANGAKVGSESRINTTTANSQQQPAITALGDGGYVVMWTSRYQDGDGWGIYAQRYSSAGAAVGGETRINTTTTGDQLASQSSAITALSDGGYVATWISNGQDGSGNGIYAQRYSSAGIAVGSETRINTTTANDQDAPNITALSDGGYVVTWMSAIQDGGGWGIYTQRYTAAGAAVDGETRINTATANDQYNPSITALSDGGYVVTWASNLQDGSGYGIFAQRFAASPLAVNHAPALDNTATPTLTAIDQNASAPSGNTVVQIVVNGSITDPDTATPPEAIVIESVNNSLGTWQFSTNAGSTWQNITGLAAGHGLALGPTALVRLLPNGAAGTGSFTFRAWDQSDGAASGTYINYTAGSGAVSLASDTANIAVTGRTAEQIFLADGYYQTFFTLSAASYYRLGFAPGVTISEVGDKPNDILAFALKETSHTKVSGAASGIVLFRSTTAFNPYSDLNLVEGTYTLPTGLGRQGLDDYRVEFEGGYYVGYTEGLLVTASVALVGRSDDALFIAFRGTDGTGDIVEDLLGMTRHYERYRPLVESIDDYLLANPDVKHVYVSGHSLGGQMAMMYMQEHPNDTRFEAVTFEAANKFAPDANDTRFVNFEMRGDPVPDLGLGNNYGKTIHLDYETVPLALDPLATHYMYEIDKQFDRIVTLIEPAPNKKAVFYKDNRIYVDDNNDGVIVTKSFSSAKLLTEAVAVTALGGLLPVILGGRGGGDHLCRRHG